VGEREPINNQKEPEEPEMSDMSLALAFATHMKYPCEATDPSGEKGNLRNFWIEASKDVLRNLKDPNAIRFLAGEIKSYKSK